MNDQWRISFSSDARFTSDYDWTATLDPFEQESFWILDAAVSVYSESGKHQFNLIGRNLGDEIYIISGGAILGRCPNVSAGIPGVTAATCNNTGPNSLDQAATTPLGRTVTLQYKYTL